MDSIFKINISLKMLWRYRKDKPDFSRRTKFGYGLGPYPLLYGKLHYSNEHGWYFKISPFRESYLDQSSIESNVRYDLPNDILIRGKDMNECLSILIKYISLGNIIPTTTDPLLFLDKSIFKQENIDEKIFKDLTKTNSPPIRINSYMAYEICKHFKNIDNSLMCQLCLSKEVKKPKDDFTNFCVLGSNEAYNFFSEVPGIEENCNCPINVTRGKILPTLLIK